MDTPENTRFCCPSVEDLIVYSHRFSAQLPTDLRMRFREAFNNLHLLHRDKAAFFPVVNGRTVAEIIAAAPPEPPESAVVTSGSLDGVRFTLYRPLAEGDAS